MGAGRPEEVSGAAIGYVYAPDENYLLQRKVDFKALAGNELYVLRATNLLRSQLVFQTFRRQVLKEAENVCRELSRATGEDCAPLADAAPALTSEPSLDQN